MRNIVVLISGRGTNLAALLQAARHERWRDTLDADIVAVISNRPQAAGLDVARAAGVATAVVDHRSYAARADFDAALTAEIDRHAPALVVLAGFMRVLTPAFVQHYTGQLVNIHPSLLPLFPGLRTHAQALAAGVRVHGATVHYVTDDIDAGGIIAQCVVPVLPGDDEAVLSARVLAQEHRLLPRAIRLLLQQRVRWDEGRVVVHEAAPGDLALLAS